MAFKNVDVVFLLKTESIHERGIEYFTSVKSDFAALLLFKRKKELYLTVLEEKPKVNFKVYDFDFDRIKNSLKKAKVKTIGVNFSALTKRAFDSLKKEFKGMKFVDIGKELIEKRTIKSEEEIKSLTKAARLSEDIIFRLLAILPKMNTEKEAEIFLRVEAIKEGVELSFDPIVASGTHSKNPHYAPTKTAKLQAGLCIIDYGVKVNGYAGDITRTVCLKRKPTKAEQEMYDQVLRAQLEAEQTLKAGSEEYDPDFEMIHSLGHGVGLDVHEHPTVGRGKLAVNQVITIEPGIYGTSFGVRIEDDYLVTKTGVKRLSRTSRELLVLK